MSVKGNERKVMGKEPTGRETKEKTIDKRKGEKEEEEGNGRRRKKEMQE